jgi:outer membrane protein TolC
MKILTIFAVFLIYSLYNYVSAQQIPVMRLSLQEALEIATDQNYQIRIAQSKLSRTNGQNTESLSGFLPKISISETFVRTNDPVGVFGIKLRQGIFTENDFSISSLNNPDDIDNFSTSFQIEQPLINVDAIYGKSAISSAVKAKKFELLRTEEAIKLEVEKAYFGLILAHQKLLTIQKAHESLSEHYREVEAASEKGLVNDADLLATEVRLGDLKEQLIIAENDILNIADGLKFLLGIEDEIIIQPTDSLVIWENIPEFATLDTLPRQRSDLMALEYSLSAARRNSKMQATGWFPRLNLFGSADWHSNQAFGQDGTNWTVGAQLHWNVLDGLGRYGRLKKANAEKEEVYQRYKEAIAKSSNEVKQAYRNLRSAKKRIEVAQTAVKQAKESLRIIQERFNAGLERSSELLQKESAYTGARLRLTKAKYDFKIAHSELVFYTGTMHTEN